MNRSKPIMAVRIILLTGLLLSVCLFRPQTAAADETDLYHESLKFDSNGNLLMTTRDKKAGSNVRYKTIGWTMKRTPNASAGAEIVRLKLEQNGASRPDPADPGYIFTYFKCIDKILTKQAEEELKKEESEVELHSVKENSNLVQKNDINIYSNPSLPKDEDVQRNQVLEVRNEDKKIKKEGSSSSRGLKKKGTLTNGGSLRAKKIEVKPE